MVIISSCIGGLGLDRSARRGPISSPNSGRNNRRRAIIYHMTIDDAKAKAIAQLYVRVYI